MIEAALLLAAAQAPSPRSVPVVVMNCYTLTQALDVELDGKWLTLTPAAKRDDTVGSCYDGVFVVRPSLRVRIRRAGRVRVFDLRPTANTREIVIDATDLTAIASNRMFLLD